MKASLVLAILLGVTCAPVSAQPETAASQTLSSKAAADDAIENVIVTGEKQLPAIVHNFVQSYVMAASPLSGAIARWYRPICPGVDGLSSEELNQFVTDRIREIARQAGAPVEAAPCRFNIEVVFTSKPQDFLDAVRQKGARLLGPRESKAVTTGVMHFAIQAWYATATRDNDGTLVPDDEDDMVWPGTVSTTPARNSDTKVVQGSRLRTGLQSEMAHVYIIADNSKTADYKLGPIADYIAMLGLSQTQIYDTCRRLPSISNLLAPDCADTLKADSVTAGDVAYLKGLYKMDSGANFQTQMSDIAAQMEASLTSSQ